MDSLPNNPIDPKLQAEGWRLMASNISVLSLLVEIWQRETQGQGWQYLVGRSIQRPTREYRLLNPDSPFYHAPMVHELRDLLIETGYLCASVTQGLSPEYEWAINVNGSNDFESNFACEYLRNRAIDEMIIEGSLRPDDNLVLFEIEPEGHQCNESSPDVALWARGVLKAQPGFMHEIEHPDHLLWMAATAGNTKAFSKALIAGARIHPLGRSGLSILHHCAALGRVGELSQLMERGADLSQRDDQGQNALHHAAWSNQNKACEWLWRHGCDLQARDEQGRTPLQLAQSRRKSIGQVGDVDTVVDMLLAMQAKDEASQALDRLKAELEI